MLQQKDFFKLVSEELDTIKKNATSVEIDNLDFDSFEFSDATHCIYGQLTGDCYSSRSREINPKVFKYIVNEDFDIVRNNMHYATEGAVFKIHCLEQLDNNQSQAYTALEKYIFMCDNLKRREIIDYLKGNNSSIKID